MANLSTLMNTAKQHTGQKTVHAIGRWKNREAKTPIGLIISFNDTSIPSGWSRFTSADDRMIVGAGTTYSVGQNGGSTTFSINEATGSGGSHGHFDAYGYRARTYGTVGGGYNVTPNETGSHSHNITNGAYSPLVNKIVLIKATQENAKLPAKSVLLNYGSMTTTGLSKVFNNERFLMSSNAISQAGAATALASLSTSGNHYHTGSHDYSRWDGGGQEKVYMTFNYAGDHTPEDIAVDVSEAIKKVKLSAWTHASEQINLLSNMIGMYESLTPPDGWLLCDGNNGTPNLRDYFVMTTDGSETSGAGTNQITVSRSTSISHSFNHNHNSTFSNTQEDSGSYPNNVWSHTHTMSLNKAVSYLPPYYSLAFIMKG